MKIERTQLTELNDRFGHTDPSVDDFGAVQALLVMVSMGFASLYSIQDGVAVAVHSGTDKVQAVWTVTR